MLGRTERISLRNSKVETEPDLHTGSGFFQKVPTPAPQHCILHSVIFEKQIMNWMLFPKLPLYSKESKPPYQCSLYESPLK